MTENKIRLLKNFIERDKFSLHAWEERGLYPSDLVLCEALKDGFNSTAALLINAVRANASNTQLKRIFFKSIANCKSLELDTEEREFAVDLYLELTMITEVDIRFNLNIFMYGYFLTILMGVVRFFKPKKIIEEYKQRCTKCNREFRIEVFKKEKGSNNSNWIIGKCSECGEYNLLSQSAGIKGVDYFYYYPEEYLPKEEYSYDEAKARLEQVKYFRK